MKHFKRLLCLMLALLMIALALASCGGNEDPKDDDKTQDTTMTDDPATDTPTGDVTAVPGGDETTAPPADETDPPVTNPPETDPPVTNPPVTNPSETDPPETTPPCEKHTFEAGKMCTEERVCTVCGEAVPAGEHAYYDGPCTVERPCKNCDYECPAAADHVYGAVFACGTQKCENCTTAMYGRYCERDTLASPCNVCGLTPPSAIPFITVDGVPIKEFTLVIPTYEKNLTHDYEHYIAALMRHKISVWHNVDLSVVSDNVEKSGFEVRIGQTNRTVTECGEDEYIIRVVNGDLEIVCGEMYSFEGLLNQLDALFSSSNSQGVSFVSGTDLTASFTTPAVDLVDGDLRILYHNIWNASQQYTITQQSRFGMFKKLYDHYAPDVLCLQEAPATYFSSDRAMNLRKYLNSKGYKDLNIGTGSHPIFYNSETVILLDFGYEKAWAYGTSWALFKHKETGKYFGILNSHFTAGSMVKEEHIAQGLSVNSVQVMDAKNVVAMRAKILEKATSRGLDAATLPIICGGDYNCQVGSEPIKILEGAGLLNVREVIEDKTKVDNYSTYGSEFQYNEVFDYHHLNPYLGMEGSGASSIDHIYLHNAGVSYTANQYRIIRNMIAGGCADHQPHYVDITFK